MIQVVTEIKWFAHLTIENTFVECLMSQDVHTNGRTKPSGFRLSQEATSEEQVKCHKTQPNENVAQTTVMCLLRRNHAIQKRLKQKDNHSLNGICKNALKAKRH